LLTDRVHYDAVLADLEARRKKLVEDNAQVVKDGEIQNLPPMRQDDALPIRRTSQYGDLQ
jgi:hypothetical protein